jgi:hypothetical protein
MKEEKEEKEDEEEEERWLISYHSPAGPSYLPNVGVSLMLREYFCF